MTSDHNDVDIEPIACRADKHIAFASLGIGPGERGEIVLTPEIVMHEPTLFASVREGDAFVEEIVHGHTTMLAGQWPIEAFRFGRKLNFTTTETVKVIVANYGKTSAHVGVSLISDKE